MIRIASKPVVVVVLTGLTLLWQGCAPDEPGKSVQQGTRGALSRAKKTGPVRSVDSGSTDAQGTNGFIYDVSTAQLLGNLQAQSILELQQRLNEGRDEKWRLYQFQSPEEHRRLEPREKRLQDATHHGRASSLLRRLPTTGQ